MDKTIVPIEKVTHDKANARKHGDRNLAAIKASLAEFGQQKPIVVNKSMVCMAGNGQLAAARALGWKDIWIVVSDLTATQLRAYAIADNRSGELAEWDKDVLASMLEAVREEDPAMLATTGFENNELDDLLAQVGAELEPEAAYDPVGLPPAHQHAPLPAVAAPAGAPTPESVPPASVAPAPDKAPPAEFPVVDENIPTDYCCPRCGYVWSGNPNAGTPAEATGSEEPTAE